MPAVHKLSMMHDMQCITAKHAVMVNVESNEHNTGYASKNGLLQGITALLAYAKNTSAYGES